MKNIPTKILLVEDEIDTSEAIVRFFQKRNICIKNTPFGVEAIKLTKEMDPDIIILDLKLDDIDGVEVIKSIREFNNKVKIIIVTGNLLTQEETEKLNKFNLYGIYEKPTSLIVLENIIKEILNVDSQDIGTAEVSGMVSSKTIPSLRSSFHDLRNKLYGIRAKCEEFIINYNDGFLKDLSDKELRKQAITLLEYVIDKTDESIDSIKKIKD